MKIEETNKGLNVEHKVANKAALQQILEAQDKQNGFVFDSTATPQKARELMILQGIRLEDNAFSCEIRRSREGE